MSKQQVIHIILLVFSAVHIALGDYQSSSSFIAASLVVIAFPEGDE